MNMVKLEERDGGIILAVIARAGSSRNQVIGVHDGRLKVAVTAVPEKGKANKAITAVLSQALGIKKSQIQLISGEISTEKKFLIMNLTQKETSMKIEHLFDKAVQNNR